MTSVNIIQKMGNIDKRVLYILLVLVLLIPMVSPLGLPISISDATRQSFDAIDELGAKDTVIVDFGYYVDGAPDVEPIVIPIFKQLFSKGVKIVALGMKDHAPMLADKLFKPYEDTKTYGTDYVNLGYLAGAETALAAWAKDLKKAFPRDTRGNPTSGLPILDNINGAADADMYIFFTDSAADEWVRQLGQYNIPLVAGLITVVAPQAEPFLASGQLTGLLAGLRSAAEYELLMGEPGSAAAAMDAQSVGHLLLILFIVFGNVSYFASKRREAAL